MVTTQNSINYKETLQLPHTAFPIKPDRNRVWSQDGVYARMATAPEGGALFVLHDGPPYANGHLHMGHALNKVLKDITIRSQSMMGKRVNYIPGWDCHGLPIEWKVEENYRASGVAKESVSILEFRQQCREFAQIWIDIQSREFQGLGVLGDWSNPYTTMTCESEACIVRQFLTLVEKGYVYRGLRPVMWSTVEQTALAEAEVEYREHVSPTVFVRFPLEQEAHTSVVIWTTTPWTLPANRLIAYAPHLTYGLYRSDEETFILADNLAQAFGAQTGLPLVYKGPADLAGLVCRHPLYTQGYTHRVPLYPADFVTGDTGTGLVHIAPEHGPDDFQLAITHGVPIPTTVGPDGTYGADVPLFAALAVINPDGSEGAANSAVIARLQEANMLVAKGKLRHSYPHSWRSKAPLIYRATSQFFVSMSTLRERALKALEKVHFTPEVGKKRLLSMIQNRPDWVVSRQRLWGVPLGIFTHKETGQLLHNKAVNERVVEAFRAKGSDVWFQEEASFFLADAIDDVDSWEKVPDILDVWFDSGTSQAFVLKEKNLYPADLYLEGSDQHRGWFQSSLLCACACHDDGEAPFKGILTHGFVVDEDGKKMSKSLGNVLSPEKIVAQYGVDVLRVWIASCDWSEDVRVGPAILASCAESYRKIRNTLRFMMGNLCDYTPEHHVWEAASMPSLEQWMLHKLATLSPIILQAYKDFDFKKVFHTLLQFSVHDLSSFYFDIRKDCLYCDDPHGPKRLACQSTLKCMLDALLTWLEPIIPLTVQEARETFPHAHTPVLEAHWHNEALNTQWENMCHVRRMVMLKLEQDRKNGLIGSSLEACAHITLADEQMYHACQSIDLAEICLTSQATLTRGIQDTVKTERAGGQKCARCWKILPEVQEQGPYPMLCTRDQKVVQNRGLS